MKIAVDAYDGNPVFYIADPKDPIVLTYQRIFPTLFQPMESMPATLRKHIRYPEDLFIIQASVYGTYHMKDPEVFYNKEDLWNFPRESHKGQTGTMQPYYTIMRLPGEPREEFILMLPMVPNNRDNMIAWLAARCDGEHYGKVIEFTFSKEKLIYGPAQIEARIDQDTTISQQLSLWNQTGSRVIRGNLLGDSDRRHSALCRAFIFERRKPAVAGAQAPDRFHRRSCRHGADCREFAGRVGHTGREGSTPRRHVDLRAVAWNPRKRITSFRCQRGSAQSLPPRLRGAEQRRLAHVWRGNGRDAESVAKCPGKIAAITKMSDICTDE